MGYQWGVKSPRSRLASENSSVEKERHAESFSNATAVCERREGTMALDGQRERSRGEWRGSCPPLQEGQRKAWCGIDKRRA